MQIVSENNTLTILLKTKKDRLDMLKALEGHKTKIRQRLLNALYPEERREGN